MNILLTIVSNRCIRIFGNLIKLLSFVFHYIFPKYRFTIPEFSKAKIKRKNNQHISRTIWQTNYSNKVTLPMYLNYLFNRLMSLDYDYRYVSTESRKEFIKENTDNRTYNAYLQLNDGAAQADLWRLIVINKLGGLYMDIDATLVKPLHCLLKPTYHSFYVKLKKNNDELTNFFLASEPNNIVYQRSIKKIVSNIEEKKIEHGVYFLTGPGVFIGLTDDQEIISEERKFVCIQGAFTNEHFQYMDKPRTKWTYKNPEDLLKK
ncbi:Glycosyltransferase sugar-binding region containing DXD motif protein [Vibrio ruber DSM 16370]|uniref:Glycosyltransferase sugar-binding region containing DXD motif protein n=1 Tax=Vibrio ruber (strain DSM 16370 / JCM 11486 / BCRC 17186 / CECT 7878 / LMG 23124 / VR1) TaxID=1123498 RepID=A0A1R4LL18_VIBR1|nr:glycosyltransferase [Vibrio ruber]SJN57270.1 Glycosyltransferase sugar-binding region containing DXD motif protein [Vibrio ruber DSM 16370]